MIIQKFKNLKKKIDNKIVIDLLKECIENNDIHSFNYIYTNAGIGQSKYINSLKKIIIKKQCYNFLEIIIKNNPCIDENIYDLFNKKEYKVILLYMKYNNSIEIIDIFKNYTLVNMNSDEENYNLELTNLLIAMMNENVKINKYFKELKKNNIKEYNEIFESKNYLKRITELKLINF